MALAAFPFGLVYGVAVNDSSVSKVVGGSASWIILAGASQLSLLALITSDAPWYIAVSTALIINARMALYSTALAPAFREFPTRWRYGLAYFFTDQAAALGLGYFDEERDPTRRRLWFLASAVTFASGWWIGTIVGLFAGSSLPDSLEIGFAVPAMFIALLVPMISTRVGLVAAVVAASVAVLTAGLPNGVNIIAGAFAGIAVGRATLGSGV